MTITAALKSPRPKTCPRGVCYISEKNYYAGEGMLTVCPYSADGHNIELSSMVVRCQLILGGSRKSYGVRYRTTT
jgi:hypothetical protein